VVIVKDFTLLVYKNLLQTLKYKDYEFLTVEEYFSDNHSVASSQGRSLASSLPRSLVLLRHDVDRKPENSLKMARLESELGIKATYYFRTIPQTLKPDIIKQIAVLGNEIGYHYENLTTANSRMKNVNPVKYSRSSKFTGQKCKIKNEEEYEKELFELAIKDFEKNLNKLRKIVPIKNICMHGSPLSKWDSRDLWGKYNYRDYGIISEPYFDIDFSKVQYITDAGRSWNNAAINLRDKVNSPFENNFKHTNNIIKAAENGQLSEQTMFNIHPEHWAVSSAEWLKIWTVRKVKNAVKKVVLRKR
jgi:hypothetical protein